MKDKKGSHQRTAPSKGLLNLVQEAGSSILKNYFYGPVSTEENGNEQTIDDLSDEDNLKQRKRTGRDREDSDDDDDDDFSFKKPERYNKMSSTPTVQQRDCASGMGQQQCQDHSDPSPDMSPTEMKNSQKAKDLLLASAKKEYLSPRELEKIVYKLQSCVESSPAKRTKTVEDDDKPLSYHPSPLAKRIDTPFPLQKTKSSFRGGYRNETPTSARSSSRLSYKTQAPLETSATSTPSSSFRHVSASRSFRNTPIEKRKPLTHLSTASSRVASAAPFANDTARKLLDTINSSTSQVVSARNISKASMSQLTSKPLRTPRSTATQAATRSKIRPSPYSRLNRSANTYDSRVTPSSDSTSSSSKVTKRSIDTNGLDNSKLQALHMPQDILTQAGQMKSVPAQPDFEFKAPKSLPFATNKPVTKFASKPPSKITSTTSTSFPPTSTAAAGKTKVSSAGQLSTNSPFKQPLPKSKNNLPAPMFAPYSVEDDDDDDEDDEEEEEETPAFVGLGSAKVSVKKGMENGKKANVLAQMFNKNASGPSFGEKKKPAPTITKAIDAKESGSEYKLRQPEIVSTKTTPSSEFFKIAEPSSIQSKSSDTVDRSSSSKGPSKPAFQIATTKPKQQPEINSFGSTSKIAATTTTIASSHSFTPATKPPATETTTIGFKPTSTSNSSSANASPFASPFATSSSSSTPPTSSFSSKSPAKIQSNLTPVKSKTASPNSSGQKWKCGGCYLERPASENVCGVCQSKKPAAAPAAISLGGGGMAALLSKTVGKTWPCKGCTTPMKEELKVCTVCNTPRADSSAPATTPAPAPSGGGGGAMASLLSKTIGKTWTCKGCTSPVNEDLNVCAVCNASRPDVSATSKTDATPVPAPAGGGMTALLSKTVGKTWPCKGCTTPMKEELKVCTVCNTARDASATPKNDTAAVSAPVGGGGAMASLLSKTVGKTWPCKGCTTPMKEDLKVCTVCNTARPGATVDKTVEKKFGIPSAASGPAFSNKFGIPSAAASSTSTSAPAVKFGIPSAAGAGSAASTTKFGVPSSASTAPVKFGIPASSAAATNKPDEKIIQGFGTATSTTEKKLTPAFTGQFGISSTAKDTSPSTPSSATTSSTSSTSSTLSSSSSSSSFAMPTTFGKSNLKVIEGFGKSPTKSASPFTIPESSAAKPPPSSSSSATPSSSFPSSSPFQPSSTSLSSNTSSLSQVSTATTKPSSSSIPSFSTAFPPSSSTAITTPAKTPGFSFTPAAGAASNEKMSFDFGGPKAGGFNFTGTSTQSAASGATSGASFNFSGTQANPGASGQTTAAPFSFSGTKSSAQQTFGSSNNTTSTTTDAFKSPFPNNSSSATPSFGGSSAASGFGAGNNNGPSFGNNGNNNTPAFGTSGNNNGPSFGNTGNTNGPAFGNSGGNSAPAFGNSGNTNAPAFGNNGNSNAPAFGSSNAGGFNGGNKPAFGAPAGGASSFGNNGPSFGTNNTGTPSFGANNITGAAASFGSNNFGGAPTFGSGNTGGTPSFKPSGGGFGGNNNQQSTFGNSGTTSAFGNAPPSFGSAAPGGSSNFTSSFANGGQIPGASSGNPLALPPSQQPSNNNQGPPASSLQSNKLERARRRSQKK